MGEAGKGSAPRPVDQQKLSENWDKVKWGLPHGCDGSCGYPFCECDAVCVKTVEDKA